MIKLYNADCLEVLKTMPDKSIELCLTDPPYGINVTKMQLGNAKKNKFERIDFDKNIPTDEIFIEIFRVSKNQIIFGGNYFNLPLTKSWFIWDKNNGASSFADVEMAWTSFNKPARMRRVHWVGSAPKWEDTKGKIHPTQKPVKLVEILFEIYGKPTSIIDPFMGSGSFLLNKEIETIGIEKEKKYYDIAVKRIEDAGGNVIQQRLLRGADMPKTKTEQIQ